jgi:hypothetical protein
MGRTIRVSAAQLPTVIEGTTFAAKQRRNRSTILAAVRTAGERKSDLLLFGEYANLHHRTWSTDPKEYVPDPIPGSFTESIAAAARRYHMNVPCRCSGVNGQLSSYVVVLTGKGTSSLLSEIPSHGTGAGHGDVSRE